MRLLISSNVLGLRVSRRRATRSIRRSSGCMRGDDNATIAAILVEATGGSGSRKRKGKELDITDAAPGEPACDLDHDVIVGGLAAPITPGGISRLSDGGYFLTYTRTNEFGRQGVFGMVTPDLICGPYGPEEAIRAAATQ